MSNDTSEPLLDLEAAAAALGVEPERVLAMVDAGLLHQVQGHAEPRFDANEVRAVHDLGG
jgi:hypothetical protein